MKRRNIRIVVAHLAISVVLMALPPGAWAGPEKVLWSFGGSHDGSTPYATVIMNGGDLFGTTEAGGQFGCGTVFMLKNSGGTWKEKVLYSFAGGTTDGCNPYGNGVTFDKHGNLYGATFEGGLSNHGVIYKLDRFTRKESVLYNFSGGADGGGPFGGLIFDRAGNIYGSTHDGGDDGLGTVFVLAPSSGNTWTEKPLHSFAGVPDGFWPEDPLLLDESGDVWGEAYEGGTGGGGFGYGIVFELAKSGDSWTENIIHNFDLTDGEWPHGGVVYHGGALYGTTFYDGSGNCNGSGCGLVYELKYSSEDGWQENVLYTFRGNNDSAGPFARLLFDGSGNIYGVTYYGGGSTQCTFSNGAVGCGTIFELTPSGGTWTEKVVYAFSGGADGSHPTFNNGSLTTDKSGNLYGTTSEGGAYGLGTVFEITP